VGWFYRFKNNYITNKNIVWLKKIQDYIFFNIKITIYWIDFGQSGLTHQICDLDYKTMITQYKTNQNKLWYMIINQPSVKRKN
jgi:hypothetical protein